MSKKIIVFASGNGSNFERIAQESSKHNYEVVALFCDRKNAKVIQRAKILSIPCLYLSIIKEKDKFNSKILHFLNKYKPDLIVLAGYMKLLGETIIKAWDKKIINIHPSLLPKYKGADAIQQNIEANDNNFGITIHYVNNEMDEGKVIFQQSFISSNRSLNQIYKKISLLEHKYYPLIIKEVVHKRK